MKRRNNLFAALVLSLMIMIAVVTIFMIRGSGSTDSPRQIHVIIDNSSDNRWVQFIAGMHQAAEDQGVNLTIMPTGKLSGLQEQESLIARAVAGGTDGVIIQLMAGSDAASTLEAFSSSTNIEIVDGDDYEVMSNVVGIVSPDHTAIGEALAREAMELAGRPIGECYIGVIKGSDAMSSAQERLTGFEETLESGGGKIAWVVYQNNDSENIKELLAKYPIPDILVALDNAGMEAAGEYAAELQKEILVIGTGTSMKALYYLDSGIAQSLVVPEDYMMGYQSVTDLAEYIHRNRFLPLARTVSHRVIHRDTLFAEENQEILFPVQR